jgi:uncharacterized Zn finger protein
VIEEMELDKTTRRLIEAKMDARILRLCVTCGTVWPQSWALATHKFDGHLLVVEQVGSLENDTKGTLSNLLADPVVDADDV